MLVFIWGQVWRISKPNLKKLIKEYLEAGGMQGFDLPYYGGKLVGDAERLDDASAASLLQKLEKKR